MEDDFVFLGYMRPAERFGYFRLSELRASCADSGGVVERDHNFIAGGLTDTVPVPDL